MLILLWDQGPGTGPRGQAGLGSAELRDSTHSTARGGRPQGQHGGGGCQRWREQEREGRGQGRVLGNVLELDKVTAAQPCE